MSTPRRCISLVNQIPFSPFLLLILFVFPAFQNSHGAGDPARQDARVVAVNDGDSITIVLNGMKYRTRLIGIDAPEMGQEPWGRKAREHLRTLLKGYRWRVSIEGDIEPHDKYDRILVYLWAPDGEMLNERMLRDGYAMLLTIQPNSKYVDRLRKAQKSAREDKRGIWGPGGLKERPLDYKKTHPRN